MDARNTRHRCEWEKEPKPPQTKGIANGRLRVSLPSRWSGARSIWGEGPRASLEEQLVHLFTEVEPGRRGRQARQERIRERAKRQEEERQERELRGRVGLQTFGFSFFVARSERRLRAIRASFTSCRVVSRRAATLC
jgi:hypothetical protein